MKQRIRHRIAIKKTKNCEFHSRETRHDLYKTFLPTYFHEESTCDTEHVITQVINAFIAELPYVHPSEELEVLFIIREP